MIVTVARATDVDQFLETFATIGAAKRREHGCTGATVVRDPEEPGRLWCVFDWEPEDYEGFLADPEIPEIARRLALAAPPLHADVVARLDT